MENYSSAVEKVIRDYLDRVAAQLETKPALEREKALSDLKDRIDKLFASESTEDEMDRILGVLRKVGEPARVAADFRQSNTTHTTHSPIFWLLMIFLGLTVGLPVAFGALGALIGLAAGLLGIIVGYIAVGIGLTLGGVATLVASFLILFAPDTLLALNTFFGVEIVQDGIFLFSPFLGGIVGMMAGGIMTGIGGLILYSTRFIFKALVALFERFASFVQNLFRRRSADSVKG